jgi:glycosyltransferase involved in cell wall biosynthesis
MRIVLDLQGAQSDSRFRGIGRYSFSLAQAIAREAGKHEIWLALNGRFPDSIEPLRVAFSDLIPTERIRVFELPGPLHELDPANSWRRHAAELLREKFLADLRPDVVHLSTMFEGLGDDAVSSVGKLDPTLPTAATLYDLIPLLHPDIYLTNPTVEQFYLRRAQELKRVDLLLAISESSGREAAEVLQISPERIGVIGAGLSESFQARDVNPNAQAVVMAKYGIQRPFVLYTGGDDPRKNLEGLVAAFALLPERLRAEHQLAIVCKVSEYTRNRLTAVARTHGMREDGLVCLGYIPDEDLRLLYATCSVFVFPSLHEGFGLPIVEAMACGAAVLGSNCTSIPEIIDREDALFDPRKPHDIASHIATVLSNSELRQSLKTWSRQKAKTFTWEACARKALRAFEALHKDRNPGIAVTRCHKTVQQPLLAFVAPLPPERTGIAAYSARLLPNLARHYEIVCIVDQPEVTEPSITAAFAIRGPDWFEANAGKFERIVYQFGNSEFHKHMFQLLERYPGVVVLHDFYLSGVLNWMTALGYAPGSLIQALYDSHGFSAVARDRRNGRDDSISTFPCNAAALRDSIGVIVHSKHAIELGQRWYRATVSARMHRVPFLPFAPEGAERKAARERLTLSENAFVVCSFGWIAPEKLSDRLLETWLSSPLAKDEDCYLIFVGDNRGDYCKRLSDRIVASEASSRVRMTGYTEKSEYRDYLAAADLAVQLRTGSRGETSAAIFDCLSRGVPLVINAHGSAGELPDAVVVKLNDDFTDTALSEALLRSRADTVLRETLAARGISHLQNAHHPERIAELYRGVIEDFYVTSSRAREEKLVRAIARTPVSVTATEEDLAATAAAVAANRERFGPPRILIDVTGLTRPDGSASVQSATSGFLMPLMTDPPVGYRVEPVRAVAGGYVYARRFACQWLGLADDYLTDDPVETGCGDLFIGLDWSPDNLPLPKLWLLEQRRRGIRLVFFACHFPSTSTTLEPISAIVEVADGVLCTSRSAADGLHDWLSKTDLQRQQRLPLGFLQVEAVKSDSSATEPSQDGSFVSAQLLGCQLLETVLFNRWYRFWPDGATPSRSPIAVSCSQSGASTSLEHSEAIEGSRSGDASAMTRRNYQEKGGSGSE